MNKDFKTDTWILNHMHGDDIYWEKIKKEGAPSLLGLHPYIYSILLYEPSKDSVINYYITGQKALPQ